MYWATTTLITLGYGDITPKNEYEVSFVVLVNLIGCGTFAYGINSIGTILSAMSSKENHFKKDRRILNRFMKRNSLDNELQDRVRKYFEYIRREEEIEDIEREGSILNKLSTNLQNEIILNTNGIILKKAKFFADNFSEDFLVKLVMKMKKKRYLPEEIIFNENDDTAEKCFYLIEKGEVELFTNCIKNSQTTSLCVLEKNQYFNEMSLIFDNPSNFAAKSINYTSILSINKQDFLSLLYKHKTDYEKFCYIRDKISLENNYEDLHLLCKLCGSKNHFIRNCPSVNFYKDEYKIIKMYQKTYKFHQARKQLQFHRTDVKLKKSHALKNRKEIQEHMFLYRSRNVFEDEKEEESSNFPSSASNNFLNFPENSFTKKGISTFHEIANDKIKDLESIDKNEDFSFLPQMKKKLKNLVEKEKLDDFPGMGSRSRSEEDLLMFQNVLNHSKEESEYIGSEHSKLVYMSNENNTKKKYVSNLFYFEMDHFRSFEFYYPKFNITQVLEKIRVKHGMNVERRNKERKEFEAAPPSTYNLKNFLKPLKNKKSFFKEKSVFDSPLLKN